MTVTILRLDGREEIVEVAPGPDLFARIAALIGAVTLDVVNLRDGRVMLVDEDGYEVELVDHGPGDGYDFRVERRPVRARKPINPWATALYHIVCHPGVTHQIVGDVAVVRDADLADPEEDDEEEAEPSP